MDIREGFKVVVGKRVMRSSNQLKSHGGVVYRFGQWTVPQKGCGPLCAFRLKKHADEFAYRYHTCYGFSHATVVPCLYEPSKKCMVWGPRGFRRKVKIRGKVMASRILLVKA